MKSRAGNKTTNSLSIKKCFFRNLLATSKPEGTSTPPIQAIIRDYFSAKENKYTQYKMYAAMEAKR